MHKRSIRFSILLVIMTLFVGFGVSFVAPKPVRADALGEFVARLSLGDFIRNFFQAILGGGRDPEPMYPEPPYPDPPYPTAVPTTQPVPNPTETGTYTYICSVNRHTVRKWSFDGTTNIANLECPVNNLCNANEKYLGLSDVMALATLCINPQQLSPTPTVTPIVGATATVTPTVPPGSTATPTQPVATPTPAYTSFSAWFTVFRSYIDGPTGGMSVSLTQLEDWRNNTP